MKAKEILLTATDTIGDRGLIYGTPRLNHQRIAARLSQTLDMPIQDWQAALLMVDVKLSRIAETPYHVDSYIDACAYLAIACELITEDDEYYA